MLYRMKYLKGWNPAATRYSLSNANHISCVTSIISTMETVFNGCMCAPVFLYLCVRTVFIRSQPAHKGVWNGRETRRCQQLFKVQYTVANSTQHLTWNVHMGCFSFTDKVCDEWVTRISVTLGVTYGSQSVYHRSFSACTVMCIIYLPSYFWFML